MPSPRGADQPQLRDQLPPRHAHHHAGAADRGRRGRQPRRRRARPAFSVRYGGFVLGDDPSDLDGTLTFHTAATVQSPAGRYRVTPGGLESPNYAISYASAWLSVAPLAPQPINPGQATRQAERIAGFQRGVQPLTPGDASFRTTVAEAPPALANPFGLSYSLGEVIQLTGGPDATQGFAPAAGGDTQGFVPAAGGIEVAQADVPARPRAAAASSASATPPPAAGARSARATGPAAPAPSNEARRSSPRWRRSAPPPARRRSRPRPISPRPRPTPQPARSSLRSSRPPSRFRPRSAARPASCSGASTSTARRRSLPTAWRRSGPRSSAGA